MRTPPWYGRLLLLGMSALILPSPAVTAQGPGSTGNGGTMVVLQSVYIPSLANAPFSCILHAEWTTLMADGSTSTVRNQRRIARDADGRIFEERRALTALKNYADTPVSVYQYIDQQAHTLYNCSPSVRMCRLLSYDSPLVGAEIEEGQPAALVGGTRERVDLGRSVREGAEVEGSRLTVTLKAGAVGNSKPLVVQREYWYSPALGFNLYFVRSDPRFGVQSFTVTDLSRDTPDPALFELPRGYKVVDERPPAE